MYSTFITQKISKTKYINNVFNEQSKLFFFFLLGGAQETGNQLNHALQREEAIVTDHRYYT